MPRTGRIWLPPPIHAAQLEHQLAGGPSARQQMHLKVVTTVIFFCQHLNQCVPPLTLKALLVTALDMMKLEKIEFSGIKGKALSQQVLDTYEEFQEAYKVFAERTYDCLDLTNTVGGTSLWEHVHTSKAGVSSAMEPWLLCSPANSFLLLL